MPGGSGRRLRHMHGRGFYSELKSSQGGVVVGGGGIPRVGLVGLVGPGSILRGGWMDRWGTVKIGKHSKK